MMEVVKFADIVTRVNTKEDRFNTDKIYYVGGDHIDSNELMVHQRGIIKGSTIGPMFYCGFKAGDILFVTRNPHLRKCAVVDFEGICSEKTFVLATKDPSRLLQEYLALVMQSDDFWNYCEENKSGGVNFFLNWSTLADYEFSLPSIEEQKIIADKLWAAYRLKESYRQLLSTTDDMLHASFTKIKDAAQKSIPLSEICSVQKGTTFTRGSAVNGTIPVIAGGQEPSCYHNVSNRDKDIITVSASGAYAGFVNFWSIPIFASDCNTIKPKDAQNDVLFIYHGLKTMQKEIYKLQKGGAQPHVYGSDLEQFLFPQVSIEKQREFVTIATQAEATKVSLRQSIDAIDRVIRSLINQ